MGESPLIYCLIIFLASLFLSTGITPLVRKIAITYGQVAVPKDSRWHRRETALLGGIGIFISMILVWFLSVFYLDWSNYGRPFIPLILCCTAMFGLGLADDIFDMDPQHKLAGQIIIASVLVFFGFRLGWTDSKTVNLVLSILWIVGITNAFNLLDNMDGLAAGVAFIAGIFLFLFLYINADPNFFSGPVLVLTAAYLGSVLGFLIHNFNPASIFMGDAGSLLIGFVLACLTVVGTPSNIKSGTFFHIVSVIAIPVLILFVPIMDTGFVSLMRKIFHRKISQGGRDHTSHRMVAIGLSERSAVLVLYVFSAVSGLIALIINYLGTGISIVVITFYLIFVVLFWIYLAKVKVYSEESILSDERRGILTPLLIEITYRRRLFEVGLDSVFVAVAYYTAYLLRFEGDPGDNFAFFLKSLPIMIAAYILCSYLMGIYRGVWGSTGVRDLVGYVKATTAGTILPVLIFLGVYRFASFSRAVFVIYWGIMIILISLSRLSFRLLDEGIKKGSKKGIPSLVYGAGVLGKITMKEIETNSVLGLRLVGFIDDNTRMHGRKIQGYPIFGGMNELKKVIGKYDIGKIVVSFREGGEKKMKEIKKLCSDMGAEVEVLKISLTLS
jgi:UDP-GlcNAc:undecaprenyl-phosphate GlcNAc-1-phosphate transferase